MHRVLLVGRLDGWQGVHWGQLERAFRSLGHHCQCFDYASVDVRSCLNHGDLLQGEVGQRHGGPLLSVAKRIWPRWLIRKLLPGHGTYLLIDATK